VCCVIAASSRSDEDFSLHEFHHEADALLENLETQLEELGDLDHLDDFDLDNAVRRVSCADAV